MTGNMTGRVFNNRYQITERIGIGGMAEVFRAQDNVLGRMVAVKTMLPQYAADPTFTQRFKQEAAAAANLQSPYIVNVYDWGQDEGTYYIVMEFVRGSDLKTAINQRGAINQRKVAEIGSQVCQALTVAHNLDIIHRDIKPQNIMVQPDGNVKVMDFGIARAKNSVKTQTSSVLGTAHYISPEQAQGKELTAASDIYSLGVVLYESATGKLPFDGPDAVSVAMKQVNDLPTPPRDINPDIDPALEAIIMKALEKNPSMRFSTVQEMRYALNDYLAGRPVALGGFTSAETAVIGGAVMGGNGMADGTAVMSPLGGVAPVKTGTNGATNYRADDDKKKSPKKNIIIAVAIVLALAVVGIAAFALMGGGGAGTAVPNVVGMTEAEAEKAITGAGFQVGTKTTTFNDTVEEGKIISQDPSANSKQEANAKINLTISRGIEQVTVPDLSGMTAQQAQAALEKLGLKASAGTAAYSDSVEVNKVMNQSPAASTKVSKGSTVEYVLSLGTESVSIPDVVGTGEAAATAALQNAGFNVTVDYMYSDSVSAGNVISQSPNANSKLAKGETVSITVSNGKEPTSSYTVSASVAGSGGYVSPSSMTVDKGESVTFTVTAESGYTVASVSDTNGKSYSVSGSGGSFTVSNIGNNIAVTVTFAQSASGSGGNGGTGGGQGGATTVTGNTA